jgi:hypothetical protein
VLLGQVFRYRALGLEPVLEFMAGHEPALLGAPIGEFGDGVPVFLEFVA